MPSPITYNARITLTGKLKSSHAYSWQLGTYNLFSGRVVGKASHPDDDLASSGQELLSLFVVTCVIITAAKG